MIEDGAAVRDHVGQNLLHWRFSERGRVVEIGDDLSAQYPHVVDVLVDRLWRQFDIARCFWNGRNKVTNCAPSGSDVRTGTRAAIAPPRSAVSSEAWPELY